ncbi:MAG: hypothetical protein WDZ76_09075 [Pseudohongiellaceae bacterium]
MIHANAASFPVQPFQARVSCALALLFLLIVSASGTARATTVLNMDIDAMAVRAELIFEGEVIAVESRQNSTGMINTYITFRVTDVIKDASDGGNVGQDLELRFAGGAANGRRLEVTGMRQPVMGETGIYFVESLSDDLVNPLLGWSQGHFVIEPDSQGVRRVSTAHDEAVTEVQSLSGIPAAIRKPQIQAPGASEVASGVVTERRDLLRERRLSVDEFKTRIRDFVEN